MALDLGSAADRMAALVRGVRAEQLTDPTPCDDYTVAALLDHIGSLAVDLAAAARKVGGDPPPPGDAANLAADWHDSIPPDVEALADAWRQPGALEGSVPVGGFDMPAEAAFTVALEELVIHGWDLAKATGQPFGATDDDLAVVRTFFELFGPEQRGFGYSPEVDVATATELDRLVAVSGRDPGWTAPA